MMFPVKPNMAKWLLFPSINLRYRYSAFDLPAHLFTRFPLRTQDLILVVGYVAFFREPPYANNKYKKILM